MNALIFSVLFFVLVLTNWICFHKLVDKMPKACESFIGKITQMLPTFGGRNPDLRSCAFFLTINIGLTIGLTILIFH